MPSRGRHTLPVPDFCQSTAKLDCKTDNDLAENLLEAGVALEPGSAFGTPGHKR